MNHKLDTDNKVFFYEQEFYVLSNFSAFTLMWRGYRFDTSEAAYHWEKFTRSPQIQYAKWECGRGLGSVDLPPLDNLHRGGIIGSVEIVDCVTESRSNWFYGRYGFVLRNPVALPFTPWRGQLGFFDVPENELAQGDPQ
jgi:hypothetical protein